MIRQELSFQQSQNATSQGSIADPSRQFLPNMGCLTTIFAVKLLNSHVCNKIGLSSSRQDNKLPHNFMAPLAFQEDVLVHEVFTDARQKPGSGKW